MAGMRISTYNIEAILLSHKSVACQLEVGSCGIAVTRGYRGSGDRQTDWCSICSVADVAPDCCGKKTAEYKAKAVVSLLNIRCCSHLWTQSLGTNWKNELMDTRGINEAPPKGCLCCLWAEAPFIWRESLLVRWPWSRPKTWWRDNVSWLAWEKHSVLSEKLMEVVGKTLVSASLLRLLSCMYPGLVHMAELWWIGRCM